jgi:hypothetical protein
VRHGEHARNRIGSYTVYSTDTRHVLIAVRRTFPPVGPTTAFPLRETPDKAGPDLGRRPAGRVAVPRDLSRPPHPAETPAGERTTAGDGLLLMRLCIGHSYGTMGMARITAIATWSEFMGS